MFNCKSNLIKNFYVVFLSFIILVFSACSNSKVSKLYNQLKEYAIKDEILMIDNNTKIYFNGTFITRERAKEAYIVKCEKDGILFVDANGSDYSLMKMDYNCRNERLIKKVDNLYYQESFNGEIYSYHLGDYIFYDNDFILKESIPSDKKETINLRLHGFTEVSIKDNVFIFENEETKIEISPDDIISLDNIGHLLDGYDLKAYSFDCYDDTIYFSYTISVNLWDTFYMCFKHKNGRISFVDCCIFNVDDIEMYKLFRE